MMTPVGPSNVPFNPPAQPPPKKAAPKNEPMPASSSPPAPADPLQTLVNPLTAIGTYLISDAQDGKVTINYATGSAILGEMKLEKQGNEYVFNKKKKYASIAEFVNSREELKKELVVQAAPPAPNPAAASPIPPGRLSIPTDIVFTERDPRIFKSPDEAKAQLKGKPPGSYAVSVQIDRSGNLNQTIHVVNAQSDIQTMNYHPLVIGRFLNTLDRAKADNVLKNDEPGTYLVRKGSKEGTSVISYVSGDNKVSHLLVQHENEGVRVANNKYKSTNDYIEQNKGVLKHQKEESVQAWTDSQPETFQSLISVPGWKDIDRSDAEKLLQNEKMKNGTYLVRPGSGGGFVITHRDLKTGNIHHTKVSILTGGSLAVGDPPSYPKSKSIQDYMGNNGYTPLPA